MAAVTYSAMLPNVQRHLESIDDGNYDYDDDPLSYPCECGGAKWTAGGGGQPG